MGRDLQKVKVLKIIFSWIQSTISLFSKFWFILTFHYQNEYFLYNWLIPQF